MEHFNSASAIMSYEHQNLYGKNVRTYVVTYNSYLKTYLNVIFMICYSYLEGIKCWNANAQNMALSLLIWHTYNMHKRRCARIAGERLHTMLLVKYILHSMKALRLPEILLLRLWHISSFQHLLKRGAIWWFFKKNNNKQKWMKGMNGFKATLIIHTISIFSSLRNVVTETAYAKVLKMDECLCSAPHVLVPNSLGPSRVWKRDSKYLVWFWFKLINSDCVIVRVFWERGFISLYLISLELGKATHCSFQSFKFSVFSWSDLIMPVKKCCVQWNWCHVSFIVISCNYTIRANALKEHMHTKHTCTPYKP